MDTFEQALKVAKSYGISDGVRIESIGTQINVTGKYFKLYFDVEDEELFIVVTSSTSYEEPVIFEMLYDEAAAFQNMEEELRPLLHECIKELNNSL